MSVARNELASHDHDAWVEILEGNRALHDKLRQGECDISVADPMPCSVRHILPALGAIGCTLDDAELSDVDTSSIESRARGPTQL